MITFLLITGCKGFFKTGGGNRIIALTGKASLLYSDNDGATFSPANIQFPVPGSNNNVVSSMVVLNDSAKTIYALAIGWDNNVGGAQAMCFRSTDQGLNFTLIHTFPLNNENKISLCNPYNTNDVFILDNQSNLTKLRLWTATAASVSLVSEFPISSSDLNQISILKGQKSGSTTTLYALFNNNKLYRTTDAGATWTFKGTLPTPSWNRLDVSVSNPDALFFGGLNAWRSLNQGVTWTAVNQWSEYYNNVAGKLHADIMEITGFKKTDGTPFTIINNHGGVAVSYDNLLTTNNLSISGLTNAQYYDVTTDPANNNRVFSGSQDQGMQRNLNGLAPGVLNLNQVLSGDYGHLCLAGTPKHLWTEYPGGVIYYYDDPNGNYLSTYYMSGTQKPNAGWMMPMVNVADSTDNSVLMGGGNFNGGGGSYLCKITATGSSFSTVQYNYDFRANSNNGSSGISAIECSRKNVNKIYVATEDGSFFYSNDKGVNWSKSVLLGPRPWYIYGSGIYSSRIDANIVWFCGSGYSSAPVLKSTDGGQTFLSMNTGLPNTLVHQIVGNENENMLFAATDAGPYVYIVADNKWYSLTGANTPIQSYTSVEYLSASNTVRFSTYGRGIWDLKITASTVATNFYWRNDQNPVSGQWNVSNYWWNGTAAQLPTGGEILNIDGNVGSVMTNDLPTSARFQLLFGNGNAPGPRTLNGTATNTFSDFSGTWPRIENNASGILHTINFPFTIGNTTSYGLELVPLAGSLRFSKAISNNGQSIYVYGNNVAVNAGNNAVQFNNTISGAGGLTIAQNALAKVNAPQTYSGPTQVDKGELWVESAGTLSGSIYVGNAGQMANTAKLWLSDPAGGTTLNRDLNVNQGNAGTRYVGGLNTSGIHTFGGNISYLGGYLNLSSSYPGGTTLFGGIISGTGQITIGGGGTVAFGGNNNYTGATVINSGSSLQVEPGGRIGNGSTTVVQVASGGQLILNTNAAVAMVKEYATGNGGTINLNSNTLTLTGLTGTGFQNSIAGTGNIIKQGQGSLSLYGNQAYTGTTTITGGDITSASGLSSSLITVKTGASFSLSTTGNVGVNDITLESGSTLNIPDAAILTVNGTINVQPGAIINSNSTGQIKYGGSGKLKITGTGSYNMFDPLFPALNGPAKVEVAINGTVNLHAIRTITDTLTLTTGTLTTGGYQINIANGGTVVRTNGHVAGNLQKHISTGATSATFEVGAATGYRPVSIVFNHVSSPGEMAVGLTQTTGAHAQLASSQINAAKRLDRYYTLINNGISFNTYSATFNFIPIDILNSANTNSFIVGKYTGTGWSYSPVGVKTTTSTQVTGITGFGDFVIGEFSCNVSATATNTGPVCPGSSFTLNGNAANGSGSYTYSWTGPNGFTSSLQNPVIGSATLAAAGTYNLTITDALNNCTATASTNVSVTSGVVPAVSISIITGNNPTCPGSSVTFKATPVSGGLPSYQWKKGGVNVGSNSNTYTDPGNTAGTVNVVMTGTLSCATKPTATSNTINLTIGGNRWIGGNGDWNNAANWCAGVIPSLADNVVIPSGATPYPSLSADASIAALDLQTGASVSLNGFKLTVNNEVSGTGTFTGSATSDLTLNGLADTLSFTTGSAMIRHLLLNTGASATLSTPLKIAGATNGSVTVNAGAILNSNGNLTIGSDLTGTAAVANSAGSIVGDVTVERYIPMNAYKSWRMLSVPIAGTQTINQAWQEGQPPLFERRTRIGTIITGTTGSSGFDYLSAKSSMLVFNPALAAWENIASTNLPIAFFRGVYAVCTW